MSLRRVIELLQGLDGPRPGLYKHFKGGTYLVLGVAITEERPDELRVVYWSQDQKVFFTRKRENFMEDVVVNGKKVPRFERIG